MNRGDNADDSSPPPSELRRFTVPRTISWRALLTFAFVLLILQLITKTKPEFAVAIFGFVLLAGISFNLSGGLTTTTGVGVTMVALKIVVISQIAKILFWQPADSYLECPVTTATVLLVGMASVTLGIFIAGDARSRPGWLAPPSREKMLLIGAITCAVIGAISGAAVLFDGFNAGSEELRTGGLIGLGRQFGIASPISIIFATAHAIVRSRGRRSVSLLVVVTVALGIAFGVFAGTKQGIFETIVYYALTCIAFDFRFRRVHFAVFSASAVFAVFVVWPVMQTIKNVGIAKSITFEERLDIARDAIMNISSLDALLESRREVAELLENDRYEYYGRPVGMLERLSLIEQDDELILATEQQGETGWQTITHAFHALVPSFIDPHKPIHNTAGFLGKRIGSISEEDDDTQISFGIIAESFCAFSWVGVVVLPAVLLFLFVNTTGRLTGPLSRNVWTVYLIGRLQHYFVENTISAFIQDMVTLSIILALIAAVVRVVSHVVSRRLPAYVASATATTS